MKVENNKLKVAIIRQELLELTGDYKQAIILNQFIYWTSRVRDYDLFLKEEHERELNSEIEFRNGWIYKTSEELSSETMLGLSPSNMRKHIKTLVAKGLIQERRNPKYKWDKTLQYRVDTIKLKKDLYDLGYSINIDGEYRISVLENRVDEIENQTTQNRKAIPEITSKDYVSETTKTLSHNSSNCGQMFSPYDLDNRYLEAYLLALDRHGFKKHKRIRDSNLSYLLECLEIISSEVGIFDWQEHIYEYLAELPSGNDGDILAFLRAVKRIMDIDLDDAIDRPNW